MSTFKTRHDALDQKAASLYAEYRTLLDEIARSGKHHEGFRRLKQAMFHLEKVVRRNGNLPKTERRTSEPRTDLFVRKPAQQVERNAAPAKTPPDLFNRNSPPVASRDGEIRNSTPPDLFNRKGRVSDPHPPIPAKKEKQAKDPKRKVVADSEEKNEE